MDALSGGLRSRRATQRRGPLFPEQARVIYDRNPIFEVVAQLRYPVVLQIGLEQPVKFQEVVRKAFPFLDLGQSISLNLNIESGKETRQAKSFYEFYSLDKSFKITLTDEFVALTAKKYTKWEDFSNLATLMVDGIDAAYGIPFFTRVGLRYIDLVDRLALGLAGENWSSLIRPSLLGIISDLGDDSFFIKNYLTNFLIVGDDFQCSFNAGLPNLDMLDEARRKSAETGNLFVLDTDFSGLEGIINAEDAIATLGKFNKYTRNAFRWAIQDQLHQALGPNAVS